jgi:hypothetical protein
MTSTINVVQYCLDDISQIFTPAKFMYAAYLQMYVLLYSSDGNAKMAPVTFTPFYLEQKKILNIWSVNEHAVSKHDLCKSQNNSLYVWMSALNCPLELRLNDMQSHEMEDLALLP